MNRIFPYVVLLASLSLAGTAAYYSVFGLSKLFSAQATAVIIMASILEISKLITASYVHRFWKVTHWLSKLYLTTALVILMCITSLGIYGFLVSAYQETAYKVQNITQQVDVLDLKKDRWQIQLNNIQSEKESLNTNISELTSGLSNNVITYVDSDGNRITTTSSSTRRALEKQLDQTIVRRDILYEKEIMVTDSISSIDLKILDLQTNTDVMTEIGPLKYVAKIANIEIDRVVNWFILLFIFVFDPLAIMLLISANKILRKPKPPIEPEQVIEQENDQPDVPDTKEEVNNEIEQIFKQAPKAEPKKTETHTPPSLHGLFRSHARKK